MGWHDACHGWHSYKLIGSPADRHDLQASTSGAVLRHLGQWCDSLREGTPEIVMTAELVQAERLPVAKQHISVNELQTISKAISPKLFSLNSDAEVFTLMMLGQADGIHPITALRRYHIIDGKPSMKADAMLACFLDAGGRVIWKTRNDDCVEAEFCNKDTCIPVKWTMERARKAGIAARKNWASYPCQMLTARVISEGVRLVMPQIVTGIYTPEEVMDMEIVPSASKPTATNTWGGEKQPEQQKQPETKPAEPAPPLLTPEQVDEKTKNLNDWLLDVLNPETFQRTEETMSLDTYKKQILTDGAGIPQDKINSIRKTAWFQYLLCMITTAPKDELFSDKWPEQIAKQGLSDHDRAQLIDVLDKNRKAFEQE